MLVAATYGNATNDAVILFLAMLAVLAQITVVAIVLLRLAAIWHERARRLFDQFALIIGPVARIVALLVALTAMGGSLYFSEVIGWRPCNLCWIQRSLIYPMTPLLLASVLWRNIAARRIITAVVFALAALDIVVSGYHYLLEWFPQLETSVCSLSVPCTAVYLRKFGYLSIPLMAGTAAITVITMSVFARRHERASMSTR